MRQERLESFDSARRTARVLPCGRVLNEPPADVRRRFVRCRRDLAAIAKLVRAPGPSCITLSGGLAPVCRVERDSTHTLICIEGGRAVSFRSGMVNGRNGRHGCTSELGSHWSDSYCLFTAVLAMTYALPMCSCHAQLDDRAAS